MDKSLVSVTHTTSSSIYVVEKIFICDAQKHTSIRHTSINKVVFSLKKASVNVTEIIFSSTECDCGGSLGADDGVVCERYGGQCSCMEGVTGIQCDMCRNGWFNLTSTGCESKYTLCLLSTTIGNTHKQH